MIEYNKFRYLFPPRPEVKSPASSIPTFEKMGLWAQPKLNGSCALIFTDGSQAIIMNRHSELFKRELITREDMLSIHRGTGWMVVVGELMNKSQKDENEELFNEKFVIFDLLVYDSHYLLNTTFEERQNVLSSIFESVPDRLGIRKISEKFYIAEVFKKSLLSQWAKLVKINMHEGLVLKKPSAKLSTGYVEKNNTTWQVKIRKSTKNYSY